MNRIAFYAWILWQRLAALGCRLGWHHWHDVRVMDRGMRDRILTEQMAKIVYGAVRKIECGDYAAFAHYRDGPETWRVLVCPRCGAWREKDEG